jgi:Na+-transporting methylmalonyl-CoA/oxaloacetate decarboxylase gamma subunit
MNKILHKISLLVAFGGMALGANTAMAQSAIDLRINEFLVFNDSNYVDDFGLRNPWLEIFNSAYNTVNIGGLYLTNDLNNPTKYQIPKGQPITAIAPQSYLVFWADNHPTRGLLHLNFDLRESKLIALFDANGRTLIDSVSIPDHMTHDKSYGRTIDGFGEWKYMPKTTPNASNITEIGISSAEIFKQLDPTGVGMIAVAMSVVFSALALLYLFYKYLGKLLFRPKPKVVAATNDIKVADDEIPGEVNAAIAMALYLHRTQLHDTENTVLTINKVSRTYSPWSSKIYGLRKLPGQL